MPGLWPFRDPATGRWLWCFVGAYEAAGVTIPEGFVTDLASIPRWLQWVPGLNPYAPDTAIPAVVHDLLLALGTEQRVAAGWFYAELARWGVCRPKRIAYFLGVLAASSDW